MRSASYRGRVNHSRGTLLVAFIVFGLVLSALSLTVEASEDATLAGDVAISRDVQRVAAPGIGPLVRLCNAVGGGAGIVALTAVVTGALAWRRRLADATLMALSLLSHGANGLLKTLAASPRPTADVVRVTDPSNGFGFPSGHTAGTVVFCAVVAYLAWRGIERRWRRLAVVAGAGAFALAVGFSRIYSGAHWPSDVLGGYLWGTLFALAIIAGWQRVHGRLAPQRPARAA